MYISHHKNKKFGFKKKKGQMEISLRKENKHAEKDYVKEFMLEEYSEAELESPKDMLISEYSGEVYWQWRAPEFEIMERDKKWYFYITLILLAIISYAIFTNSLVMAITFILIGAVGYIHINKKPRVLNFAITSEGLIAGREIYEYDNLKSFWIFYEPNGPRVISLHTKSYLSPYVHIPIHFEEPVKIREALLQHIAEEKQEQNISEILNRFLRL